MDQNGLTWDVGVGLSFPVTIGSREFRIEPSLSYGQDYAEASSRINDGDGRQRGKTDVMLSYLRPIVELSTPFLRTQSLQLDGLVGISALVQVDEDFEGNRAFDNAGQFEYDKSVGVSGFVGIRLSFALGK